MKDNAVNFILSLGNHRGSGGAYAYIQFNEKEFKKIEGGACHASFGTTVYEASKLRTHDKILAASSAMLSKDHEMQEMFWNWASSKNSPWHKLFENGMEPVRDNVGLLGWCISGEGVNKVPFNFIKNFAIVCRSLSEHSKRWELWKTLVKKGVLPTDAMYLVSMFIPSGPEGQIDANKLTIVDVRTGGHWGLTDYHYSYPGRETASNIYQSLDWKRWTTGDINLLPVPAINGFFCKKDPEGYKPFDIPKEVMKTEGGKFAQVQYYPTENVLDEFYKWKDQYNV